MDEDFGSVEKTRDLALLGSLKVIWGIRRHCLMARASIASFCEMRLGVNQLLGLLEQMHGRCGYPDDGMALFIISRGYFLVEFCHQSMCSAWSDLYSLPIVQSNAS